MFRLFLIVACLFLIGAPAFGADDALDEVNAQRIARGLQPFERDDGLTLAAMAAADFRAARLIEGHSSNDFAFLPEGSRADAAGCAAWPQGAGFGACCIYEGWRKCGAAFAIGRDGRRFMHVFVCGSGGGGVTGNSGNGGNTVQAAPPVNHGRRMRGRR